MIRKIFVAMSSVAIAVMGVFTSGASATPTEVSLRGETAPSASQPEALDAMRKRAAPKTKDATAFPNGLFDQPVTKQPIASDSTAVAAKFDSQIHEYYGAVTVNGLPVLTVGAHQQRISVAVAPNCNNFTPGVGKVPIPASAYVSGSTDDPLVITQPATHTAWELWKAVQVGGGWQACWGGRINTATSDGVFPSPYGLSASGISYLATTVTNADVTSGVIRHALALDVVKCDSHVAPATRGDCTGSPGEPSEGTWFRMPRSVPMPVGMTPYAQLVFRALQTYGAVVMDQAGVVAIQGESTQDWTATGHVGESPTSTAFVGEARYAALNGIPWSDLQVIVPPKKPATPTAPK